MGFTGKDEVAKLKCDFFLKDIWRKKNWEQANLLGLIPLHPSPAALTIFFISKDLVELTRLCDIQPCHFSDHDFVSLTIDTRTFRNRGPGVLCLNTSILSDPNYKRPINDFFDQKKPARQMALLWDNGGII